MLIKIVGGREKLFLGGLSEWGVISLIGVGMEGMRTRKKIRRLCWKFVGMLHLILCWGRLLMDLWKYLSKLIFIPMMCETKKKKINVCSILVLICYYPNNYATILCQYENNHENCIIWISLTIIFIYGAAWSTQHTFLHLFLTTKSCPYIQAHPTNVHSYQHLLLTLSYNAHIIFQYFAQYHKTHKSLLYLQSYHAGISIH